LTTSPSGARQMGRLSSLTDSCQASRNLITHSPAENLAVSQFC
jgi:hypothetical protein